MKRQQFAEGLRALADKIESLESVDDIFSPVDVNVFIFEKEQLTALVRSLGKTVKNPVDGTMFFEHFFVGHPGDAYVKLSLGIPRDQVCRRVVTTKTLPAEPERVVAAEPERVVAAEPERVVEVEDWICDEPLLAPAGDQADGLRAAVASSKDSIGEEIREMQPQA